MLSAGRMMSTPSESRLSRRDFLAVMSAAVSTACWREAPFDRQAFTPPARSAVGLFAAASYSADLADIIFRGFRELGVNVAGRRVFLKPNMVEYEPGTAINTHPAVVASAIARCRRGGAGPSVVVGVSGPTGGLA